MKIKVRRGLAIGMVFVLLAVLFTGISLDASAETWTQTTDTDFETGELENVEIVGTGESAFLQLKTQTELGVWHQQHITPPARYKHTMAYDSVNNKIVLFGGWDPSGRDDETWVYDLACDTWTQMNPSLKPSARIEHSMAYDSTNNKIVLFGGVKTGYVRDDETWVYDVASDTWTKMNPITKPSARTAHAMTYDSVNNKVVLFGGDDGTKNDETWVYDVAIDTWTQMNPTTKPLPRYRHAMAYDSANNKIVLFGGSDDSSRFDETWVYDVVSDTWTQMNPERKPSARDKHAMTCDLMNNKIMLFGGEDSSGRDDDTWIYDMTSDTWTEMNSVTVPLARFHHAMAYDSVNNKIVLFGGYDGSYNNETWIYDAALDTWTLMNPPVKPSARCHHAMAYDSANSRVVLFGGVDSNGRDDETWVYDTAGGIWTKMYPSIRPSARNAHAMAYDSANKKIILFGGYDGNYDGETWIYDLVTNTWAKKNPSTKPSARNTHAMVYDSKNNKVVLFGGYTTTSPYYNDETWVYDVVGNTWTQRNPSSKPSARHEHAMVYDSTNNRVVLFGGYTTTSPYYNDETWLYNVATDTWKQMNPSSKPLERLGHSMTYDSANNKVVLFGGYTTTSPYYNDETWVYDVATATWTEMNPTSKPLARDRHAIAYDSVNNKVVLLGGGDRSIKFDETWIYDLTSDTWTQMNPATKPSARSGHAMAFDSMNNKIVLFSGRDSVGNNDETWVYDVACDRWTQMNPATKPQGRFGYAMVYDSTNNKFILFGGGNAQTWVYDLASDSWTQMNPATKPSERSRHAMVYDSANNKVVLFGGDDGHYNDETWVYDLASDTWTQMNPTTKPSERSWHAMAYDSANNKVVLFGGEAYSIPCVNDETWVYDVARDNWTQMNPITKPSGRFQHTMVYDSTNNKIILFGGDTSSDLDDETWIFDLGSNTWIQMNTVIKPPSRYRHGMAYDSLNNKVVLFGGSNDTSPYYNDETWVFNINDYHNAGTYTSKTFTASDFKWQKITWATKTGPDNFIRFQVAVNNDGKTWNYVGPDGTSLTYFDDFIDGELFKGYDLLRYRAYFTTSYAGNTPKLYDVSVSYTIEIPKAPTVKLTSPNGGEDWMKDAWYPLTWTASGDLNTTPVCLYYSTDNGETWTAIAEWMANTGHYNWTVPNIETANALIKVTVTDIHGNTVSDTSDASFAIDPPQIQYVFQPENSGTTTTDHNSPQAEQEPEVLVEGEQQDKDQNTGSDMDYNLILFFIILALSLIFNMILMVDHTRTKGKLKQKFVENKKITGHQKFGGNRSRSNIFNHRANQLNLNVPSKLEKR